MIIRSNNFVRNLLFFLIVVYFAQGSVYATGSVIAKLSLLLIVIISCIYLTKSLLIKSKKEIFYYSLISLIFLNIFGFMIAGYFDEIYFSQLKDILTALLPFFPFYYFAYKGDLSKNNLLWFFVISVPIVIIDFYNTRSGILSERLSDNENVVTNTAYMFTALIPYIFLWGKNKFFSIFSLILLLFFVIQGAKRGALIVGVMGTLVFVYYQLIIIEPRNRLKGFSLTLVGVVLLIVSLYYFYVSNDYLVQRFQEIDGGSGRDVIFLNLLNNWVGSNNIINYLFGFGFMSTIQYSGTGNLAHNDWLELLTNFGLLGIFIYLFLFYGALRLVFGGKLDKEDKLILLAIICMWFLTTFFSMYYTSISTVFYIILIGYFFGMHQRKG